MISIHALRGEGDTSKYASYGIQRDFYPRPPWGGRLVELPEGMAAVPFLSTPSVGRATAAASAGSPRLTAFLSTPSVGRATTRYQVVYLKIKFLSTPSVGRATSPASRIRPAQSISIHALRGEGDNDKRRSITAVFYFYPRPPWGGRPKVSKITPRNDLFLSTPSVGRAT